MDKRNFEQFDISFESVKKVKEDKEGLDISFETKEIKKDFVDTEFKKEEIKKKQDFNIKYKEQKIRDRKEFDIDFRNKVAVFKDDDDER